MRSQSDWQKTVDSYGGDWKRAFLDQVEQVGLAALGGFISGTVSGGTMAAVNYAARGGANKNPSQAVTAKGGDGVQTETDMDATPKYSIKQTSKIAYQEQLAAVEQGKLNGSNSLYMGAPSQQMQAAGLSQAPFAMNQGDYRKSRRAQGNNKNYSAHEVSYDFFENLPQHLETAPMLIDNGNKVTVITDYAMQDTNGNDSYVIAGVWTNQLMENDTVNLVKSVYPLNDITEKIRNAAEQGILVVTNENKAEQMLASIGIDLPSSQAIISLAKSSLSQNSGAVKGADSSTTLRSAQNDRTGSTAQNNVISQAIGKVAGDPVTAQELEASFNPAMQTAEAFGRGIREAYEYGRNGFTMQEMLQRGSFVHDLTQAQQTKAYTQGQWAGRKGSFANYKGKQAGIQESYLSKELRQAVPRVHRAVDKLGKALGMQVQIVEMHEPGMYQNGVMYLSSQLLDADNVGKAVTTVVYHEVTHRLQDVAPKLYTQFRSVALQRCHDLEWTIGEYQKEYAHNESRKRKKDEHYKARTLTRMEAMDEIAADFTEELLAHTELFHAFIGQSRENRIIGKSLKNILHETIQKVKDAFTGHSDAGTVSKVNQELQKLQDAAKLWDQMLAEGKRAAKDTAENSAAEGGKRQHKVTRSVQRLYTGVNLSEDGQVYSYDFLTALPDMRVVTLPEIENIRTQGKIDTRKVIDMGTKNARSVGTERDGKVYVQNRYTGHDLRIDVSSIRHGLNGDARRLLTNARLGAVIGDVAQNAVPINALYNHAEGVTGTYAMAQYATDSNGREFVAIVTVEQRSGDVSSVEVYDVIHAVSGRQKKSSQASTKLQGVYPIKAANITIADVLEVVKSTHQSILSESVLESLGEERNPDGDYTDKAKFSIYGAGDILKKDQQRKELQEDIRNIPALVRMTTAEGKTVQFLPSQLNKAAAAMKEKNGAEGSTKELNACLESFFRFMYSGEAITEQSIRRAATPSVDWLMAHHQAPKDPMAQQIAKELRGRRITLDDTQRQEAAFLQGSYADYRKALMGHITIANDGTPLDIAWQELAEEYPYYFDAEATASDMPRLLMEVFDRLQDARLDDGSWSQYRQEIREDLYNQVYDSFWQVSTVSTAEAYQKEIAKLKAKHDALMKRLEAPEAYYQERYERKEASRVQRSRKAELRNMLKRRVWELLRMLRIRAIKMNLKMHLK